MTAPLNLTHRERTQQFRDLYDQGLAAGEFYAFAYPYGLIPSLIIVIYLLSPSSKNKRNSGRFLAWLLSILSSAYIVAYTRARYTTSNALTGLAHSWLMLWLVAHFLAHDPKGEYFRIKKIDQNSSPSSSEKNYVWQAHPDTLEERYNWTTDLLTSLNGMGWSWAIRSMPAPPKHIQEDLKEADSMQLSKVWEKSGQASPRTEAQLRRRIFFRCLESYVVLDFVKTLISLDPYFWGFTKHQAPSYLPLSWQSSPVLVKSVRLLLAQTAAFYAVRMVLMLKPIYFISFHPLGQVATRRESWMWPDDFGSYLEIGRHGLAGFWSLFWHQSFRYVYETPALLVVNLLQIGQKEFKARVIRVFVSFTCSGLMHAGMSHTSIGQKSPFRGSFLFFMLQPFGIFLQYYWLQYFRSLPVASKCPKFVGALANIIFTNVWLYYTAPLFIEDMSTGGWFLFEPVPVSMFRGLGYGAHDDGWITLHGRFASFRFDSWRTGIVS
jgi:hypothetical protein